MQIIVLFVARMKFARLQPERALLTSSAASARRNLEHARNN